MAIKLYAPKTQAFVVFNPTTSDMPLSELLLFNILLELQVLSELKSAEGPTGADAPSTIRADLVGLVS